MTIRTSKKTVTIRRPFVLGGFGEASPAGARKEETDDAFVDATLSRLLSPDGDFDRSVSFARRRAHRASKKLLFDAMKANRS